MYRKMMTAALAAIVSLAAAGQTSDEFKAQYERQVRNLGYSGVGVETIINRWQKAFPEDADMLLARFNYDFAKSRTYKMVQKDGVRYLGQKPSLTLKDGDGKDVNYFQEPEFDEELFNKAISDIDVAIAMYPDELRYRYEKMNALLEYEKETPVRTEEELSKLIDLNSSTHPSWTLDGDAVTDDYFVQGIGEYCYNFFKLGTPEGYDDFLAISEKMNKLYPKNTAFIDNIGSYWQVAKKDNKKAAKYYKKALKISPDDYAAKRNMQIIQSSQSPKGQSSK